MKFTFVHANLNVTNLEKSVAFYNEALSLTVSRRIEPPSGDFALAFLADSQKNELLELTWVAAKNGPYDLGDNESHIAFSVENFEEAKSLHIEMGVICYENEEMGIYFIEDPDGYWVEILPSK